MCVWGGGGGSLVVTFSPCALQHFWLAVCLFGEANERVVAVCVCVCGRNEWLASKSGGCLALTKI